MEIIKKLIETEDSKKLKDTFSDKINFISYEEAGPRKFEWIRISDNIALSIQASFTHYCSPRKTIDKEKYTSMELAIIKNNELARIRDITDNEKLINAFDDYCISGIYGCVPIALLEELYQELLTLEPKSEG